MTNGPTGINGALHLLRDVEVEVTLEIGRKRMKIGELLRLGTGQTLELEKAAGEPLEIVVNGRVIGRGEAIVIGDRYGVRITEIVSSEPAQPSVRPTPRAALSSPPEQP